MRLQATEDHANGPVWSPPADFEERLLADRAAIIEHALTLLIAYVHAGRPAQKTFAWSGFEHWTDHVVSALRWAGSPNPLVSRSASGDAVDDDTLEVRQLFFSFAQLKPGKIGLTVGEILARLSREAPETAAFRRALDQLLPEEWTQPRKLGAFLKRHRGKRIEGLIFDRVGRDRDGFARWSLRPATPLPAAESAESELMPSMESPVAPVIQPALADSAESQPSPAIAPPPAPSAVPCIEATAADLRTAPPADSAESQPTPARVVSVRSASTADPVRPESVPTPTVPTPLEPTFTVRLMQDHASLGLP